MNRTLYLVNGALFAALTCVATMCIHIPTPGTGGYIHPGDALVILSGITLGPLYGALAAGIGSALADMLFGYYIYVPITFVIKAAVALTAGFLFGRLQNRRISKTISCVLCGVAATLIVAGGYYFFEVIIYGKGAIASVPANLLQGVSGLIISTLLLPVISRIPVIPAKTEY